MTILDLIEDRDMALGIKVVNLLNELNIPQEEIIKHIDRIFIDFNEAHSWWITELLPNIYGERTSEIEEILNQEINIPYIGEDDETRKPS